MPGEGDGIPVPSAVLTVGLRLMRNITADVPMLPDG
jgi:hypothetical protein